MTRVHRLLGQLRDILRHIDCEIWREDVILIRLDEEDGLLERDWIGETSRMMLVTL